MFENYLRYTMGVDKMAKPKKKRVVWAVEPRKEATGYTVSNGLITGLAYHKRKYAAVYGKPVKFIEA